MTPHFHGIHPAEMHGVPGSMLASYCRGQAVTYQFDAIPFGLHPFHCHVGPLAEHIARGMYGTCSVEPVQRMR